MDDVEQPAKNPEQPADERQPTSEGAKKPAVKRALFVVGVGSSAGGLTALSHMFHKDVARTPNVAYVVVSHYPADQRSMLPDLLSREASLPVEPARNGQEIEAETIYIAPPDRNAEVTEGRFAFTPLDKGERIRLPIDRLFRSLADQYGDRAIGVVLSGSGSDGTQGARAIHGNGGYVIAQEPVSAEYPDMPGSVIGVGVADLVLAPPDICAHIADIASRLFKPSQPEPVTPAELPADYRKILHLVRDRTGNDFLAYKASTMRRRIDRRLHIHQLESPEQYLRLLGERPHEVDLLFSELLIGVTNFFRDPAAFEALGEALNKAIEQFDASSEFRAWVPACSTGEEAYSVAILLREILDRSGYLFGFQVFGTDIDAAAIAKARAGRYPTGIAVDVGEDRLHRYFAADENGYRLHKHVRDSVIFAQQNILKDPPFVRLHLLCCRNLLIYMEQDLQRQIIPLFHYALRPGGLLMLGPSEGVAGMEELFEPVNKRWKLFRRRDVSTPVRRLPFGATTKRPEQPVAQPDEKGPQEREYVHSIERVLLNKLVAPTAVVDIQGDIVFVHGRIGDFLEPPAGRPSTNVVEMARPGLGAEIATVLRQALHQSEPVVRRGIRLFSDSAPENEAAPVVLTGQRIESPETLRGLVVLTFRHSRIAESPPSTAEHDASEPERDLEPGSAPTTREQDLQERLRYTKESLHGAIEELETSNEELKAANEELQSANEELQSVNEELETSREETQSLNEELQSVNVELQDKVDELANANDDMQNLLDNTDVAAIFLDRNLRIKRYTEKATTLVRMIPSDIGRPLSDLKAKFEHDMVADAQEVLRTREAIEREVIDRDGELHLMRMRPYRTADGAMDGVAISLLDIRVGGAEYVWREVALPLSVSLVEATPVPMIALDPRWRVLAANEAVVELLGAAEPLVGKSLARLGSGNWNLEPLGEETEGESAESGHRVKIVAVCPELGEGWIHVRKVEVLPDQRYTIRLLSFGVEGT